MRKEERRKALREGIKRVKRTRRGVRKGFTIMEFFLVMIVAALLVSAVYFAWRMLMGRGETDVAVKKTQAVVSIIDSICRNNGGVCPAVSTTDITTDPTISVYLPENKVPYKSIGYSCEEGDDQEVEITIPLKFFHSDENRAKELCKTAADYINKNFGKSWVADRTSCDTGALVITSEHRVCQSY